jgi:hypothetical protein
MHNGGKEVKESVPVPCGNEDLVDMSYLCAVKYLFFSFGLI